MEAIRRASAVVVDLGQPTFKGGGESSDLEALPVSSSGASWRVRHTRLDTRGDDLAPALAAKLRKRTDVGQVGFPWPFRAHRDAYSGGEQGTKIGRAIT
jgi:hypothetical protein